MQGILWTAVELCRGSEKVDIILTAYDSVSEIINIKSVPAGKEKMFY